MRYLLLSVLVVSLVGILMILVVSQAEKSVIEVTTKISDYPDWLINNPSWEAAREFTNSPFDNFDIDYIGEKLTQCNDCVVTINNLGFRGSEFSIDKPDKTYRIFSVGGSTTHGATLVNDNETWPAYLQQKFDQIDLEIGVEVINAGIMAATTEEESKMIKDLLVDYEPNLIIMYDGWNDIFQHLTVNETIQNWQSVCKLGNEMGFETIIILQPLAGTGNRVLTDYENQNLIMEYVKKLHLLTENLVQLNQYCTKVVDFRGIFDYVQHPIFTDAGHTRSLGNQIIAENVFAILLPIISIEISPSYEIKTEFPMQYYTSNSNQFIIYAVGADFTGRNFDGLDLRNAILDRANLSNASFEDSKLSGARLVFADLTGTDLSGTDFSNSNLARTDLSKNDLTYTILRGANLSYANLSGQDLSDKDFTDTILRGANLSHANLGNFDFSGRDLTGVNLSGQDLSSKDLIKTILSGADLTDTILPDGVLSGKDFIGTVFNGVDLSGKDLSYSKFNFASFDNANLENVNLNNAEFIQVDLTSIKNNSLAGADLSEASFAWSNLSGVNLSGVILGLNNFNNANLSGLDFTVIFNASFTGSIFEKTNLSNSNFEGVDLSSKGIFSEVFKNKAHLKNLDWRSLAKNFISPLYIIHIISTEVRENDLAVNFILFNNFINANFENSNFKNADLTTSAFYSANLTNADLSGADLSNANFDEAILDEAILNCLNHPICKSG